MSCRKESPYVPGELAKLADRRRAVPVQEKRQPVARHDSVTSAVTEHGTPLPRPAPPSRSLSPPLEPLDDGTVRVFMYMTVLTIGPVWQGLERALTFLLV